MNSWPYETLGFPDSSAGKESSCHAGVPGLIPGLGILILIYCRRDRLPTLVFMGFSCGSAIKNLPALQETWVQLWTRKIPWRRERLPTPVFWPGEFHELYSLWGHKNHTQMRDFHFIFKSYDLNPD